MFNLCKAEVYFEYGIGLAFVTVGASVMKLDIEITHCFSILVKIPPLQNKM